jgi:hypothetical protein
VRVDAELRELCSELRRALRSIFSEEDRKTILPAAIEELLAFKSLRSVDPQLLDRVHEILFRSNRSKELKIKVQARL